MPGRLTPLEVARKITPAKYPDGEGLYLVVAGPKSRNWSYRHWIKGKERWLGLGSLNDVSLREARIKRDAARQQVRAGVDIVRRNDRSGKKQRLPPPWWPLQHSSNVPRSTLRKIGESGARSIGLNGRPPCSATPTPR